MAGRSDWPGASDVLQYSDLRPVHGLVRGGNGGVAYRGASICRLAGDGRGMVAGSRVGERNLARALARATRRPDWRGGERGLFVRGPVEPGNGASDVRYSRVPGRGRIFPKLGRDTLGELWMAIPDDQRRSARPAGFFHSPLRAGVGTVAARET